ncbi:exopolysaccharide inner membrane protein-like protein [Penicillium nucicola]|uniref:exopolysaccharide inner membrane protein-like protein n=1 Tax=Penicillium nucicola TaxID=1850975 RepID=UPI0025453444|nr:exopolysaccharide inner membrane protein-like protein [Penicillium nucicola]KAJ5753670.1 exopolysaccharide inner membrane protein-like protein [Penicillium nucicola]
MYFRNIAFLCPLLSFALARPEAEPFAHPGALHTNEDIQRIREKVKTEAQPWYRAWQHLESAKLAQTSWISKPHEILVRGTNATWQPTPAQNYGDAYRDAHSAYQLTIRWLIGGNTSYADHAVDILNGWGSTLRDINGTEDKFLAAGLYGYQFANAAELLRIYPGWTKGNQTVFATMLNSVFAKYSLDFLEHHNYKSNFYYANWDLCNIASLQAIGIFTDNRTMYNYATHYWQHGLPNSSVVVNGALPYFSVANFTEESSGKRLMEIQESGRDQGHSTLCIALLGVIGQQGWNQGEDLFSTYQHEILNGAEYVAKYNTNNTVLYTPYTSWEGLLSVVAEKGRFTVRPGYEAVVSHYSSVKHLDSSWSMEYRDYVNSNISGSIEGGGGDYGPNSGGYDVFGHDTLLYRIESGA